MRWSGIAKTKERLQIDPVECGAISLGIVLDYFGAHYDSRALKEATRVSKDGANALSIIEGAQSFGLDAKARKLLLSELKNLRTPAILFFDNGHFVVYEGSFKTRFYINDPGLGRTTLSIEEMAKRYSHVAITLEPNQYFQKTPQVACKHRFVGQGISAAAGFFYSFLFAVCAFSLASLVTAALNEEAVASIGIVAGCSVIMSMALMAFGEFIKNHYAMNEAKRHVANVQNLLFHTASCFFLERPRALYEEYFSRLFPSAFETILNRVNNSFYAGLILGLLSISITISGAFLPFFVATLLIFVLIIRLFSVKKNPHLDILSGRYQRLQNTLNDLDEMGQKDALTDTLFHHYLQIFKAAYSSEALRLFGFSLFGTLSYFSILFVAIKQVERQILYTNDIIALVLLFFLFTYAVVQIKMAPKSADTFLDELKSFRSKKTVNTDDDRQPSDYALCLNQQKIIIKPSEIIAIISTDQRDIQSFFERFRVSDTDRKVYFLGEDVPIAFGTLFENVSLRMPRVTMGMVAEALKSAALDDVFRERHDGLLSFIEDEGHNLSQGQKKRLLLARALCHKADLILLDNFFSFLDEELSLRILSNLRNLQQTTLFAPYRASECRAAHRVIFLHKGEIIADAPHEKLLVHDERYSQLFAVAKKDGGFYGDNR